VGRGGEAVEMRARGVAPRERRGSRECLEIAFWVRYFPCGVPHQFRI